MRHEIISSMAVQSDSKNLSTIICSTSLQNIFRAPEQIILPEQFQFDESRKNCIRIIEGNYKILYQFKKIKLEYLKFSTRFTIQ